MNNSSISNTLIIISGATAVGKTDLAIELALKLGAPILSADSRQLYTELNIGVAKPSKEELEKVKHYFIDHISIQEEYNVGKYEIEAIALLADLFKVYPYVVMVGGTGLYIDAIVNGIDIMPKSDDRISILLQDQLKNEGLATLLKELKVTDPEYFAKVDKANHVRVMRALNVIRQSGKPFSSFQSGTKAMRDFTVMPFQINIDRNLLYDRINLRVDKMIKNGLKDELIGLKDTLNLKALATVGYGEWRPYFESNSTEEQVVEMIKQHTRNYAKRQITWFSRKENFQKLNGLDRKEMLSLILSQLK
jgi:tRNA dimethylallyltransferase